MSAWKQTDVFPIIAAKIERLSASRPGFVPHDAIVEAVLADPEAAAIVETAHHAEPERSPEWLAHNMVAWFSQRISMGESEWADRFDREFIDGKWAYRPRRET